MAFVAGIECFILFMSCLFLPDDFGDFTAPNSSPNSKGKTDPNRSLDSSMPCVPHLQATQSSENQWCPRRKRPTTKLHALQTQCPTEPTVEQKHVYVNSHGAVKATSPVMECLFNILGAVMYLNHLYVFCSNWCQKLDIQILPNYGLS